MRYTIWSAAAGQRAERLPAIHGQGKMNREVLRRGDPLTQRESKESTEHHPHAADQHDEHALAHDAHRAQYVDLDQHQADEDRQPVMTQEVVGGIVKWDQPGVGQNDRRRVDENQRGKVIEYFPAAFLFEPEPEADDGDQYGHDAGGRSDQGAIH
jgi:hypothetical protein